jgi:hypothetical protein
VDEDPPDHHWILASIRIRLSLQREMTFTAASLPNIDLLGDALAAALIRFGGASVALNIPMDKPAK